MQSSSQGATVVSTTVSAERLAALILGIGRRCSRQQYDLCRLLADYDLSGHWARSGAVTCSRWAADALEVETSTAREWLRVGHALRELPVIGTAFAEGQLSYAKVRTLTRVAVDHADRQDELIELAVGCTASELGAQLARWTGAEEDEAERDRRHRREMFLSARTEPDGATLITARLPPLEGARVMARVDAHVHRARSRGPGGTTTEGGSDAPADAPMPRSVAPRLTLAQRRALALVALLTDEGSPAPNGITELLIHLRGDGASLSDGTPVAGHLVERLAPAAFFRALVHDAEGRPINASARQRHPTARQRRVVAERDGYQCVEEGCTATEFLDFDHDPPYEITGHTVVDELHLRCSKHHRDRHRGDGPT